MTKSNKKKMGYKQYEKLLVLAHKKSEILAERYKELQTYFMAYLEYRGDNIEFNKWIDKHVLKMEAEAGKQGNYDIDKKETQVNEKV